MTIKDALSPHLSIDRDIRRSPPKDDSSKNRHHFKLIDLFAGAGGLSLGFTKSFGHSFVPVWANDFNEHAAATYDKNFGSHSTPGDILDLLADPEIRVPQADVVIGGPPCQGFSLLNKKRSGDPRKQLWRPFLDVVKLSGAQVFVMENVPQLLGSEEHKEIVREAQALGFRLAWGNLMAADYGVPQIRRRAFIIGCLFEDPNLAFPPRKTHYKPQAKDKNADTLFEPRPSYISNPAPWRTIENTGTNRPAHGRRKSLNTMLA